MGRLALFLVLSAAAVTATVGAGLQEVRSSRHEMLAESEASSLARQAALSGLAITERQLTQAFGAGLSLTDVALEGGQFGTYDAEVTPATGGLAVEVTGRFEGAEHTFTAFFAQSVDIPAALMVYGSELEPKVDKEGDVTGLVTRPPSIPSAGWSAAGRSDIAGIAASSYLQAIFNDKLDADELARITGAASFVDADPPTWVRAVADEVESHASAVVTDKFELKEATLGSVALPAFVVATEEIVIDEAVGYGVLYLRQGSKIQFKNGARWEGLVLIEGVAGGDEVEITVDQSSVYGAVIAYGIEADPDAEVTAGIGDPGPGLAGGHFDLDFFTNDGGGISREYHKHEWDDKYDLTYLDFLDGPDIKASYQTFLGLHGHKMLDIEFYNEFNGSGTYQIGSYAGVVRDDLAITARPNTLDPFRIDFENLQELRGSNPGTVKGDLDRDRSFSVRFYDGGTLLYEVTAYEHAKAFRDGVPTGTGGSGTGGDQSALADPDLAYGEFKVEVGKDGGVYWAPDTISRLQPHLTSLADAVAISRRLIGDAASVGG